MNHQILECIDVVQEQSIGSEIEVINSMIDVYMKQLTILENYQGDDLSGFAIFQEADSVISKSSGKFRQFVSNIMELIQRLIDKIIHMINQTKLKSNFKKYLKLYGNVEGDQIISPNISEYKMDKLFNDPFFENSEHRTSNAILKELIEVMKTLENQDDKSIDNEELTRRLNNADAMITDLRVATGIFADELRDHDLHHETESVFRTYVSRNTFETFISNYLSNLKADQALLKELSKSLKRAKSYWDHNKTWDELGVDRMDLPDDMARMDSRFGIIRFKLSWIQKMITKLQQEYMAVTKGLNRWLEYLIKHVPESEGGDV